MLRSARAPVTAAHTGFHLGKRTGTQNKFRADMSISKQFAGQIRIPP